MRKFILVATILFVCINLISCSFFFDDIIDPVGDFSRGSDEGTLVFGGNNYILIDEVNGNFRFDITEGDVLLGQTSNFPFFPNFSYYANAVENADYIASGSASNNIATCVYLREDLYQSPLCYVLQDTEHEFDFLSAFVKTEEVSYKTHIEGKEYDSTRLNFYVKDYPRLTASIVIFKIDEKWYYVEQDKAFVVSEALLNALVENDLLS